MELEIIKEWIESPSDVEFIEILLEKDILDREFLMKLYKRDLMANSFRSKISIIKNKKLLEEDLIEVMNLGIRDYDLWKEFVDNIINNKNFTERVKTELVHFGLTLSTKRDNSTIFKYILENVDVDLNLLYVLRKTQPVCIAAAKSCTKELINQLFKEANLGAHRMMLLVNTIGNMNLDVDFVYDKLIEIDEVEMAKYLVARKDVKEKQVKRILSWVEGKSKSTTVEVLRALAGNTSISDEYLKKEILKIVASEESSRELFRAVVESAAKREGPDRPRGFIIGCITQKMGTNIKTMEKTHKEIWDKLKQDEKKELEDFYMAYDSV